MMSPCVIIGDVNLGHLVKETCAGCLSLDGPGCPVEISKLHR